MSAPTCPSVWYSQSRGKGGEARGPRSLRSSPKAPGQDLGPYHRDKSTVKALAQLTAQEPHAQLCPEGPETHFQGATGSGPLTFLHLLAGRGSSSVSEEVEELGSLSALARKQALGKGGQLSRAHGSGGPTLASGLWAPLHLPPTLRPPDPYTVPFLRSVAHTLAT